MASQIGRGNKAEYSTSDPVCAVALCCPWKYPLAAVAFKQGAPVVAKPPSFLALPIVKRANAPQGVAVVQEPFAALPGEHVNGVAPYGDPFPEIIGLQV